MHWADIQQSIQHVNHMIYCSAGKKMGDIIAAKSLMEASLVWPPVQGEVDLFL